jgi:hypothetical protein
VLFLIGLALGMAIIFVAIGLNLAHLPLRWYEWLLAVIGSLFLLFAVQNFQATRAEHWSEGTPLTFLLTFGLPGIGLIIVTAALVIWRYLQMKKPSQA